MFTTKNEYFFTQLPDNIVYIYIIQHREMEERQMKQANTRQIIQLQINVLMEKDDVNVCK